MKIYVLLIVMSIVWTCSAQDKYTYYLTGRPFSVERNNAILTTGHSWNISFEYAGNDIIEMNGFEKINSHNDSVSRLIAEKTKLGNDWLNEFYKEVDEEENHQAIVRSEVLKEEHFNSIKLQLIEPIILIKRKNCFLGDKYMVYIIGQSKMDESRGFYTYGEYVYKIKSNKLKFRSNKKEELPFSLPQNGIL